MSKSHAIHFNSILSIFHKSKSAENTANFETQYKNDEEAVLRKRLADP